MNMNRRTTTLIFSLYLFGLSPESARAQPNASVVPEPLARQQVEVRDVIAAPERVQGVVVNHTDAILRNVVLLVRYEWLWLNERHPGEDTMSFGDTMKVVGDIPPGGTVGFAYMPTRVLPNRQDGYYKIGVSVQSLRKTRIQTVPAG